MQPRKDRPRQPHALSNAARRRALATLTKRANAGDVAACEALVRLNLLREAEKAQGCAVQSVLRVAPG